MTPRRRVGRETSATRHTLLDCVERLMLDEGYAAVTYRAVAAKAGVTAGLVQYYFPTLDELFVAVVTRRSEQNLTGLREALARGRHPLRVLWEHSNNEATASLTTEFLALGNHRKSIRSAIAELTNEVRDVQFAALAGLPDAATSLDLPPEALLFLVTAVPKLLQLEEGVDVAAGHAAIVDAIEHHLDSLG